MQCKRAPDREGCIKSTGNRYMAIYTWVYFFYIDYINYEDYLDYVGIRHLNIDLSRHLVNKDAISKVIKVSHR
jgi:hypothetical protein